MVRLPPVATTKGFTLLELLYLRNRQKARGFTLLELLIVITIIGLLAGVIVVVVNPLTQLSKTRDLERKNTLKQLQGALEQYYSDNGVYPDTGGAWYSSDPNDACCVGPAEWIPGLIPDYIKQLPEDPLGGDSELVGVCTSSSFKRAYMYRSDGQEYKLIAHCSMENASELNDPSSPMYDPNRPSHALMVCEGTSAACNGW